MPLPGGGSIIQRDFQVDHAGSSGHGFDLHESVDDPSVPAGVKLVENMTGRVFRYCHFGGNVSAGGLVAVSQGLYGLDDTDNIVDVAAPAGVREVTLQHNSLNRAVGHYGGSILHVTGGAGQGTSYVIRSSRPGPNANEVVFELYDQLQEALATTSDVAIVGSPWLNLVAAGGVAISLLAGVVMRDQSSGRHGWVQTWGPALALADTAVGGALGVIRGGGAGEVNPVAGNSTAPVIGHSLYAGDGSGGVGVFLTLHP